VTAQPRPAGATAEAHPVALPASEVPAVPDRPGHAVIDRPHTRLILTWPQPPAP
jgi:hypothetical protein